MIYIIKGEWPKYTVTGACEELVVTEEFCTFDTVMKWFISRMEQGDTIVWVS